MACIVCSSVPSLGWAHLWVQSLLFRPFGFQVPQLQGWTVSHQPISQAMPSNLDYVQWAPKVLFVQQSSNDSKQLILNLYPTTLIIFSNCIRICHTPGLTRIFSDRRLKQKLKVLLPQHFLRLHSYFSRPNSKMLCCQRNLWLSLSIHCPDRILDQEKQINSHKLVGNYEYE